MPREDAFEAQEQEQGSAARRVPPVRILLDRSCSPAAVRRPPSGPCPALDLPSSPAGRRGPGGSSGTLTRAVSPLPDPQGKHMSP